MDMVRDTDLKRVKRLIKGCPNPLFESWLEEWKKEAEKQKSDAQYCFSRALKSLRKYPFKLETGKECFILENFGTKLCMMIDKKLDEYNKLKRDTIHTTLDLRRSNCDEQPCIINKAVNLDNENGYPLENKGNNNSEKVGILEEDMKKRKGFMDSPGRILKSAKNNDFEGKNKQKKNTGQYLPSFRSGGYALLLTLFKNAGGMTKEKLIAGAEEFTDTSFKKTSSSYYTAWSSMSVLIKKDLVTKFGKPVKYTLTEKGNEVAKQLLSLDHVQKDLNKPDSLSGLKSFDYLSDEYPNFHLSITMDSASRGLSDKFDSVYEKESPVQKPLNACPYEKSSEVIFCDERNMGGNPSAKSADDADGKGRDNEDVFFLLPNGFEILLYIDTKEIEQKQNVENDKIVKYLKKRNIKYEVKFLNLGDYIWVCRDLKTGQELVLPFIVERKRMDDLASSIKDGRFHEQKFRLRKCGIQNCIYLVEKYGNDSLRLGLPLPTIQQAISNTRVVDGFYVKMTNNNEDSLSYLTEMTNILTRIFKGKTLVSCSKKNLLPCNMSDEIVSLMPFAEFNRDSAKMRKYTVKNMFLKHLLQFNGLSVEKARAIVKVYCTPRSLIEALQRSKDESAIASITCSDYGRSIGPALAKSLFQLYTSLKLN